MIKTVSFRVCGELDDMYLAMESNTWYIHTQRWSVLRITKSKVSPVMGICECDEFLTTRDQGFLMELRGKRQNT